MLHTGQGWDVCGAQFTQAQQPQWYEWGPCVLGDTEGMQPVPQGQHPHPGQGPGPGWPPILSRATRAVQTLVGLPRGFWLCGELTDHFLIRLLVGLFIVSHLLITLAGSYPRQASLPKAHEP